MLQQQQSAYWGPELVAARARLPLQVLVYRTPWVMSASPTTPSRLPVVSITAFCVSASGAVLFSLSSLFPDFLPSPTLLLLLLKPPAPAS